MPAHGPGPPASAMHSAASAATCGVAMLVPEIVSWPPPGQVERTQTPGAAIRCAAPALVAA